MTIVNPLKKKVKVLLVEDQILVQKVVEASISDICDLKWVTSVAQAELELREHPYSLIVLDVVLPDGSGFEFCRRVRAQDQFKDVPIIFLTGQGEIDHRVHGFSLGADDYVVKPFEPKEFRARIEVRLKKLESGMQTSLVRHNFRLDLMGQKAFMTPKDGAELNLNLTPIEFKLLAHFMKNEGQTFSREELMNTVWGKGVHVSAHTVDTHISSLRKKNGRVWSLPKSHHEAWLLSDFCVNVI